MKVTLTSRVLLTWRDFKRAMAPFLTRRVSVRDGAVGHEAVPSGSLAYEVPYRLILPLRIALPAGPPLHP